MNWKKKAFLQNMIARLPSDLSYAVYEWVQMNFGAYRHGIVPFGRLEIAGRYISGLRKLGFDVEGARVLEVGSGRTFLVPIGCWLCGASEIISVDLHRYLSEKMFMDDLKQIQARPDLLEKCFEGCADSAVFQQRLKILMGWDLDEVKVPELLSRMNIDYRAPSDASALDLADESIDLHLSVAVLEHIPPAILRAIFDEGTRVLKKGGWFVHRWDMSDHFSHKDKSIVAVNFLSFDEREWEKYNGNRYMYVNRLRIDFFDELFASSGLVVEEREVKVDEASLHALRNGLRVVPPFDAKPDEVNATIAAMFFARK